MRKRIIFVSDVHMGAGAAKKHKLKEYDWLTGKEADHLASFLKWVNKREDVAEVVLLGDIMDDWVCPVDVVPPTYQDIVKAEKNKKLVESIRVLGKNKEIRTVYLPGNHDMSVTPEFVAAAFPGVAFGGSAVRDSVYTNGRLHGEHGSAYALFNAPDPVNDPRMRLPLGYFISRAVATKSARTGIHTRHYWSYLDDMFEAFGPASFAEAVFEAVLEEAGLDDDCKITMRRSVTGKPYKVLASDVKKKYGLLYDQWVDKKGATDAFYGVLGEFSLGRHADRLARKGNARVVVFGHNHTGVIDKDSMFVKDRIYVNCGSWCDKENATYVEYFKEGGERHVYLMSWDGKKAHQRGYESIN